MSENRSDYGFEWSISELVKHPNQAWRASASEDDFKRFCLENREELQREICAALPGRPADDQVWLGKILSLINPELATEQLTGVLERVDPGDPCVGLALSELNDLLYRQSLAERYQQARSNQARRELKKQINRIQERTYATLFVVHEDDIHVSPSLQYWIAPEQMDDHRLFHCARRHLDFGGQNEHVQRQAMALIFKLRLPQVMDVARTLLDNHGLKMGAAEYLGERGDPAGWPVLRDYIENQPAYTIPRWKDAVICLARQADPDLREDMGSFARAQIQALVDDEKHNEQDTLRAEALVIVHTITKPGDDLALSKIIARSRLDRKFRRLNSFGARLEHVLRKIPGVVRWTEKQAERKRNSPGENGN